MNISGIQQSISNKGFAIVENVFSNEEIENLVSIVSSVDTSKPTFRRTNDLFAIRQFFKEIPIAIDAVFTSKFDKLLDASFGNEYFVVKSIYFDKPGSSNWFVSYHQDLTISVDKKLELAGYGPWTTKHEQFAVQPPLEILQDNFTARIHLDDTTEENGALRVVPGSHTKGIYRPETINWNEEIETVCCVTRGSVMFMKPLLLHSSGRTTNNNKRRVIHIEFSRRSLPSPLQWSELISAKAHA